MHDILILAPPNAAATLAESLRRQLDLSAQTAPDRVAALSALRSHDFTLIVLDEAIAAADPKGMDLLYKHAGAATVLELNFVVSSAPRLTRQIRSALTRGTHDRASALAMATASLRGDLGASLTGLLLESELLLRAAPLALAPRLRHLVMLAGALQNRLRA